MRRESLHRRRSRALFHASSFGIARSGWFRVVFPFPFSWFPRRFRRFAFILIIRRLGFVLSVGIGVFVGSFDDTRSHSVVSFAFIRVAVHLPRDDLLIELTVMLDGIVVAIRQDSRSELLFAVIAVKSNDGSLEFGAGR